jgi:RNA polymerase sigma-70 factor (ECF subfamily)
MFLKFSKRNKTKKEVKTMTDEELIFAFKRSKDNEFFGEIFQRYTHLIFGVCMKYLRDEEGAKDAVMQVFEKLFEDIHQQEIRNFKSWIYTVAKNHCLMKLRKGKTILKEELRYKKSIQSDFMELADEVHHNGAKELEGKFDQLHKAISLLNKDQKECIELLYLQNNSYKQVAEITGYSMKQVKSYIQNGKRNLKNYLEKG